MAMNIPPDVYFQSFWPEMTIDSAITLGRLLPWQPLCDTHLLTVGPKDEDHDRYHLRTCGSSFDGGDELRFDTENLLLVGMVLTIPDKASSDPSVASRWLSAPLIEGLPRLGKFIGFNLDPMDVRHVVPGEPDRLICVNEGIAETASRFRLSVANDVEMFFADGGYCGWGLTNPARHLSCNAQHPNSISLDMEKAVACLLFEYFAVVEYDNIERLNDRDHALHKSLMDLLGRTRTCQGAGALSARIEDILDRFYD